MRTLAAFLLALALAPFAHAETVTVFAATSLKESLDAAVKPFEAATGNKVVVSYAGSNALAKQIEAGAPATLFISADLAWLDYVEKRGLTAPGTRRNLLGNDLVLIAPAASTASVKIAPGFDLAGALGGGRLAIADPDAVPAGKYAKAALASLGAWSGVQGHVAPGENVRAALALVSRGEAPLGIVYRTDAMAAQGVRIVDAFPGGSFPAIVYPMVELKPSTPATHALARHLASPATRAVWEHYGFRVLR
ncbi:MAG TPA: molybdate ABC transporter substrate-binding protein [Usitatibacter sp.]|jgi:molybdate transport system substrate-binding protein|nr:molybdate ABC transporter substrate-binding protein [Usitatibacter sp.]